METLIYVAIFAGVFALIWWLGRVTWAERREYYSGLKREPEGHIKKEFVEYFSGKGVSEQVSRAVYRWLSESSFDVPVLPGDVLKKYFPEWDDLDQLDDLWFEAGWRPPVTDYELGEMWQAVTVEDMVMIVDRLRKEKDAKPIAPRWLVETRLSA